MTTEIDLEGNVETETPLRLEDVGFESQQSLTRLGKYDVLARLGQGGMAGVYLAVARGAVEDFRKLVVLKVLHENFRREKKYVEMFMREAQISADLAHPNVVHTYTVGEEDGQYCIVMEYLDGVSLSAVLKRVSDWPLEKRLPLLGALCLALSGLHYVHEFRDMDGKNLQLVHRDVKPANIFITFDGQVKVLDFGVAKMTTTEVEETAGQAVKGTVQYIAPEALDVSRKVDRRTDVFAAGLMTWEIARGKRFWGERNHLQILRCLASGEMPDLDDDAGDVAPELIMSCRQALSFDPDKRHATALDLKRDIQSFLIMEGFRIDTEQLAAIVKKMFGPVREKRQAVIQQQLKRLREDDGSTVVSLAGTSEPLDFANPSDTDISVVMAPPTGSVETAAPSFDEVNRGLAKKRTKEESSSRRWLWLAAIGVPLLALGAYSLLPRDGAEPSAKSDRSAASARTGVASNEQTPAGDGGAGQKNPDAAGLGQPPAPEGSPTSDPATNVTVTISVVPTEARIFVDGVLHGENPATISADDPDVEHEVIARAPGYVEQLATVRFDESRDVALVLKRAAAGAAGARQSKRRRRRTGASAAPSAAMPAESPPKSADPVPATSPKPGDDLKRKSRQGGKKKPTTIDADVPWGQ